MTLRDVPHPRRSPTAVDLATLIDPERVDPGWRSVDDVAAWLLGAREAERLARADAVREQAGDPHRFLSWQALGLARLGTTPTLEDALDAVARFGPPGEPELTARVLATRRLWWLRAFAEAWVERAPHDARATVDELVRLGVVARPVSRRYAEALTAGLAEPVRAARIRARLLATPATVQADVHTMLTAPGAGARLYRLDRAHHAHARRLGANTWTVQIARLVAEDLLDRASLIELCLAMLDGQVDRPTAVWFAGLYEHLEPTAEDAEPHVPRLRRMLGSHRARVVALAQRSLLLLARAEKVNGRELLEASAGPLARPEKQLVIGQLRLLAELVRVGPGFAPAAVRVAWTALGHDRADVQLEALRFVSAHGDQATLRRLAAAPLAPALRAASAGLAAGPVRGRPPGLEACARRVRQLPVEIRHRYGLDVALAAVEAGRFPHLPPPSAALGRPLPEAVDDPVELAGRFALAMEADVDPLAVQQLFAAAVRTSARPRAELAAAWAPHRPAAERLRAAVPFAHRPHPRRLVAELAECWADGRILVDHWLDAADLNRPRRSGGEQRAPQRLGDVLPILAVECTRLMARRPGSQLLSDPTHTGGTVAPEVLLGRLPGVDERYPHVDVELAALRLPRGLGDDFWDEAARRNRFAADWLRTYYANQSEPRLRTSVGVPAFRLGPRLGDGPGRAALAHARPGTRPPGIWWALTDLDGIFEARPHRLGPERAADATVAYWPTTAPWHPELVAAHLLVPLAMAQQSGSVAAPAAAAALDAPTGGLGAVGHLALVQALQGVRAPTRLAAAGVWRAVALDARLDPALAVAAIDLLQGGGLLRPARLVSALRSTVDDPVVGYRTLQVLTAALGPLFAARAGHLHLLLGLAEELAARFGADAALEDVRRAADPRKQLSRHRAALPATGPERPRAALAALHDALTRAEEAG